MSINHELAEKFTLMADALEFKGENPFKIRAYRKASRIIKDLPFDLKDSKKERPFTDIPGIGSGIAKKIEEYIDTGKIAKFVEETKGIPKGIFEMLRIPYLGPKTLKQAYNELSVDTLKKLKKVMKDGSLAQLPGMGEKRIERMMDAIQRYETSEVGKKRFLIGDVYPSIEEIVEQLKKVVSKVTPCGSYRRMQETVGDIDLLAVSKRGKKVIDFFIKLPCVKNTLSIGSTKASVILTNGIQVDLRVVKPQSFGACLQYFTGSKSHNVKLRTVAKSKGLKISEYGIFKGKKMIAGRTEKEVYEKVGIDFIPPEMREDHGEIERALDHTLPKIVEYEDFKGDLHIHSDYSDGKDNIEHIAKVAKSMRFQYVAICDHSQSAHYAGGLSEDDLLRKNDEIDRINEKVKGITVLKGAEVDILTTGKLDYPERILKTLDIVIAAIHQGFKKNVTERFLETMENPSVHIIAHPTGRLLSRREGYDVDLEKVFKKAQEKNVILEINAFYDRLDLNDKNVARAKEYSIKFSIGTDAHNEDMMKYWRLGIGVARRAWLDKNDVVNCYTLKKLKKFIERKQKNG
jgi:DNA polymerase (family 10)